MVSERDGIESRANAESQHTERVRMSEYVIVDLRSVTESTDEEVTVEIVSDTFDDPHEAEGEMKKREGDQLRSTGRLEVVEVDSVSEMAKFYAWVDEMLEEQKEEIVDLPANDDVDEISVAIGKFRALEDVKEELADRIQPTDS